MAGICTGQCLRAPLQSVTGNQPRDSPETDGRHKRLSNALYRKGILRANPERPEESRNTAEFGVEHLRRSQCSQGSVVTRLSVHG